MAKHYDQYCPVAHALELVGERWALLVVRELLHGPKRYTDLADGLPGIGTNILASRLRDLEAARRRREADAAAAGRVPRLRADGLRPRAEAGHARARTLGRPLARAADRRDELFPGWLVNAVDIDPRPARARRAASSSGSATRSPRSSTASRSQARSTTPTSSSRATPKALYYLFVDRRLDGVSISTATARCSTG